jgi:hypothetical protein
MPPPSLNFHSAPVKKEEDTKMKKLMAVLILVLVVMLSAAAQSEAACNIPGKIVYAVTNGVTYTVYVAPSQAALPTFYYVFTTVDPEVISTLNAAQASNFRVLINGNAAACGTGLYRTGGTITLVAVYSLF